MTSNSRSASLPPRAKSGAAALPNPSAATQSSRHGHRRSSSDADSADATNDKATIALIRRVLCPDSLTHGSASPPPLEELLPPLTSSNEIDLQLYALLAVIVKEFVYAWYAKITPDRTFVDELLQLIAHCTRALEQRLRRVDVEQLLLDEIPRLIEAHILAFRTARQGSGLVSVPQSLRQRYHALNPHPALSPVPDSSAPETISQQSTNEGAYRHLLAQGALAVLLPTEDLENVCLRTLVEDILADLILGNEIGGRMCEGPFIWEIVSRVITLSLPKNPSTTNVNDDGKALREESRLAKFGLLETENEFKDSEVSQSYLPSWLLTALHAAYLIYNTVLFVISGLLRTAFASPHTATDAGSSKRRGSPRSTSPSGSWIGSTGRTPVIDYGVFSLLSHFVDIPQRMPWLSGLMSLLKDLMLAGPGRIGDTDGVVDRFLRETIQTHLFTTALLPTILRAARVTLFPSNTRRPTAPSTSKPTQPVPNNGNNNRASDQKSATSASTTTSRNSTSPETSRPHAEPSNTNTEQRTDDEIKRQCARDIYSIIPRAIAHRFFIGTTATNRNDNHNNHDNSSRSSSSDRQEEATTSVGEAEETVLRCIEADLLDPFSDPYCNKHLVFAIIETILVRLLPELSENGVRELMEERGVVR